MDLHEQLARDVRNLVDRDAALAFLRAGYANAIRGTEWETLAKELTEATSDPHPYDRLELYEVEDRGVGVVWPDSGFGHAWVWSGESWRYAPGLVNKSWIEGRRYSSATFANEFPDADLVQLEVLARGALNLGNLPRPLLHGVSEDHPDLELITLGYHLTLHLMRLSPVPFRIQAKRVADALGMQVDEILPYVESWYSLGFTALGEPKGVESPWLASQTVAIWRAKGVPNLKPEEDAFGDFLWSLPKSVERWAAGRFAVIAEGVRKILAEMPPSGIFDRENHETVWDEFCLQVQHGPESLERAWAETIDPIIDAAIERLPRSEAVLLTCSCRWTHDDFSDGGDLDRYSVDDVRQAVFEALKTTAQVEAQDWVTG